MSKLRRILDRLPRSEQRERYERTQTRLGRRSPVAPGLADYDSAAEIERRAREIHYDVLRREGTDRDRALEIAADSSEQQARLLERQREAAREAAAISLAGRSRYHTPYGGPYAGQLCRVGDDGELTPVGDP
jgi:hypothetical protein